MKSMVMTQFYHFHETPPTLYKWFLSLFMAVTQYATGKLPFCCETTSFGYFICPKVALTQFVTSKLWYCYGELTPFIG